MAHVTVACGDSTAPASLPELPARVTTVDAPRGPERPGRELTLALVGEVRGEVEPCGCPTLPFGGFARRQRALDQLRERGTVFHLDAGELLLKGQTTTDRAAQEPRIAAMLELSAAVGVDAWAPGPTDLAALGVKRIATLVEPPAVNATWTTRGGERLLPAATVVERDGIRLAVIGLAAEPTDPALRDEVLTLDAVEAAKAALLELPDDIDLVVGLGTLHAGDAERVAALPGISAMLTTRGRSFDEPRPGAGPNAGLVIEAPDRGRYVEVVDVRIGSAPGEPLRAMPGEGAWRDLALLRKQSANGGPSEALAAAEAERAEIGRGRNICHAAALPLAADLDVPESGSKSRPDAVSARINELKAITLEEAAARAEAPPGPTEPGYAAGGRCLNCHTSEFSRWSLTGHAGALQSLIERESTSDPECLGCHTTGFGEPGGFGDPTSANIQKFKGVQCEACHGPLLGHPDVGTVVARPVTIETCLPCHDDANSPQFDYVTYLRRGSCQEATALFGGSP